MSYSNEEVKISSICFPSEDIVAREIEGEIVIIPLVSGIGNADEELYTLNETGKAIWQKLDGQRTIAEVITALEDEFIATKEQIESDVVGFVREMVSWGILKLVEDSN